MNARPPFAERGLHGPSSFAGTLPTTSGFVDGDVRAPQTNGSPAIRLNQTGSRLMMAVIRDGALWTCHHVGLSGTNGSYSGNATGTNVDRSAVQWLKLTTDTNGNFLSVTNGPAGARMSNWIPPG